MLKNLTNRSSVVTLTHTHTRVCCPVDMYKRFISPTGASIKGAVCKTLLLKGNCTKNIKKRRKQGTSPLVITSEEYKG